MSAIAGSFINYLSHLCGALTYTISASHEDWLRSQYTTSTPIGIDLGKATSAEAEAYIAVYKLVLDKEIRSGTIRSNDQNLIKDFRIHFRARSATYTNPRTKDTETVDLLTITEKPILEAIKAYYDVSGAKPWHDDTPTIANSKGNRLGEAPLQKKNDAVLNSLPGLDHALKERLPQLLAQIPPEQALLRDVIARRFLFVENYYENEVKKNKDRIAERKQALGNATTDAERKGIQSEISNFESLQQQLQDLDFYALTRALMILPVGPLLSTDRDALAEQLREAVEKEIYANKSFISKLPIIGSKDLTEAQKVYAVDVGELVYRGKDRVRYFEYCRKHQIEPKSEGLTDRFVEEAVVFADTPAGQEYTGEGFKTSTLIDRFGESSKKMAAEDLGQTALTAFHAIGRHSYDQYPPGASEDDKKAIDKDRPKYTRDQLEKHRTLGVDRQMTYETASRRRPPEPTIAGAAAPLVAAAGSALAAASAIALAPPMCPVLGPAAAIPVPCTSPAMGSALAVVSSAPSLAPSPVLALPAPRPLDVCPAISTTLALPASPTSPAAPELCYSPPVDVPESDFSLRSIVRWGASKVPESVSGAVNHILLWAQQHPGELTAGSILIEKLARQIYELKRQSDGSLKRQLNYKRIAFAAFVLYAGYNMYNALTDGKVDGSFWETAGGWALSVLQPVAGATMRAAKYIWDNPWIQTPLGLRLPFTSIGWGGALPTALIVKPAAMAIKKASEWISGKTTSKVTRTVAGAVVSTAEAVDEVVTTVSKVQGARKVAEAAVPLIQKFAPSMFYAGSFAVQMVSTWVFGLLMYGYTYTLGSIMSGGGSYFRSRNVTVT